MRPWRSTAGTLCATAPVSGRFTAIERITVRNAAANNIQIGGGSDHLIQCNRILANMASDSLKGVDGAGATQVRHNDFTQWDSQAIDLTNVHDWTIEDNDFHEPKSSSGNAIGAKFGTRAVRIVGNRFPNTRGLSFGGTGTPHPDDYERDQFVAESNTFNNVGGAVIKFFPASIGRSQIT